MAQGKDEPVKGKLYFIRSVVTSGMPMDVEAYRKKDQALVDEIDQLARTIDGKIRQTGGMAEGDITRSTTASKRYLLGVAIEKLVFEERVRVEERPNRNGTRVVWYLPSARPPIPELRG